MITFDAFLVFLAAASLPVTYIYILSRWVEPEYLKTVPAPAVARTAVESTKLRLNPA